MQTAIATAAADAVTRALEAANARQRRAQTKEKTDQAQASGDLQTVVDTQVTQIAELEAANNLLTRRLICQKFKLADDMALRLQGATEAELEADAKKLAGMIAPPPAPKTEAGAGNKPAGATPAPATAGAGAPSNGAQPKTYAFQQPGEVPWS